MAHQRFRRFNTGMYYKDQDIKNEMCMAVRAGNLIFLRGQTGFTLDGGFIGKGDAAAQAEQAMKNVKILLEEAGGRFTNFSGDLSLEPGTAIGSNGKLHAHVLSALASRSSGDKPKRT